MSDDRIINSSFHSKVLVITGGTGSFGSTVLKHFINSDLKEIRILSRDEKKKEGSFKVTPPNLDREIVMKKIKIKWCGYENKSYYGRDV